MVEMSRDKSYHQERILAQMVILQRWMPAMTNPGHTSNKFQTSELLKHKMKFYRISNNMVNILSGQHRNKLIGVKLGRSRACLGASNLPFRGIPVTPAPNDQADIQASAGYVVGGYSNGYLRSLIFPLDTYRYRSGCKVLGVIVSGQDVLQDCYENHNHRTHFSNVSITDCGLL